MICLVCALLCLPGCSAAGTVHTYLGLGAVLRLVTYGDDAGLSDYASSLLREVEACIDPTVPTSDVARFNAAEDDEAVSVAALTYRMVTLARSAYDLTDGLYDPTLLHAVDLWRFLPRAEGRTMPYDRTELAEGGYPMPSAEYVAAFASLCDMRRVEAVFDPATDCYTLVKRGSATVVEGQTYYAALDLGGLAKGYVVEELRRYADAHRVRKGYMSFGSSSLVLLTNRRGQAWDLSLTHPRGDGTYCTLPAADVGVATSGDYQNYYVVDGVRYCHLLDPRTACPMRSDLLCVTVIGGDAAIADALSTALTVGGLANLRAFAEGEYARQHGLQFVAVYMTDEGPSVYATCPVEARL